MATPRVVRGECLKLTNRSGSVAGIMIDARPLLALGSLTVLLTGCGSELTAAGSMVRVGRSLPHPYCREVGMVMGSAGGGAYTSGEYKMENAQIRLRNRAGELGANYVVMDVAGSDIASMTISGRAFVCGPPPPGAPVVANPTPPFAAPVPAPPPAAQPAAAPSAEERLRKLKALADQGLITPQEYEQRKKEILQSL